MALLCLLALVRVPAITSRRAVPADAAGATDGPPLAASASSATSSCSACACTQPHSPSCLWTTWCACAQARAARPCSSSTGLIHSILKETKEVSTHPEQGVDQQISKEDLGYDEAGGQCAMQVRMTAGTRRPTTSVGSARSTPLPQTPSPPLLGRLVNSLKVRPYPFECTWPLKLGWMASLKSSPRNWQWPRGVSERPRALPGRPSRRAPCSMLRRDRDSRP